MWVPGPGEWLIILLIVVVLFGARKLPELGRGLGEGLKNFRRGIKDATDKDAGESADNDAPRDKTGSSA
jgi:sec-independent protein translocase protein TatA